MGLLNKALSLQPELPLYKKSMGLFFKASAFKTLPSPESEPVSIIRSVYKPDDSESIDFQTIVDDEENFYLDKEAILNQIQAIQPTIEAPVSIFKVLKKTLAIKKGALLLLQKEKGLFFPWALTGYDETTNHRLRIPKDIVDEPLNREDVNGGFFLEPDFFSKLDRFFSFREFSILETLFFLPLSIKNEVFGLLLISDSGAFEKREELKEICGSISEALNTIISKSRGNYLNEGKSPEIKDKSEAVKTVEESISKLPDTSNGLLLFLFDLSVIVTQILEKNNDADPLRLREDILRIITPMVSDIGVIINLNASRLLLIIPKIRVKRNDLFSHQIVSAVKGFFSLSQDSPNPISHIKAYPEDGQTGEALLADFQS